MIAHLNSLYLLAAASPPVDAVRDALARTSDRWFFWLVMSSIAVGIGVCLEAPEATIVLKRWYLHWKRVPDIPPENERRLAIPIEYLGLLFVILGVIGEGICELGSSSAETALRAHDEQIMGDAQLAAAQAQQKANEAAKQAGLLGVKVDTLPNFVAQREGEINGELSQFKKYASELQNQTATALDRLKTDTAVLNKATEDAKIAAKQAESERAAMAEANAPRYLNGQQQVDFVNTLKAVGKFNVQLVQPPSTTPDAGPLASLLEALIKQANWDTSIMVPMGGWAKYVQVCPGSTPQPNVLSAAAAIVNSLNQAKIPTFLMQGCDPKARQYGAGDPIKNADMIIYVGSKF